MASKQLGKLRQWAGEKISFRDKGAVSDEFKDLEKDIELRKEGISRLQAASENYHHVLSKKKDSEAANETEKLLPIDALGIVMITHGEEFGEDSAFGTSLVEFGRAHCKIATLQESYAIKFQETFISSCRKFVDDIKDYEHQKKKLESRRVSYDTAVSKMEKIRNSKKEKEKERREAEDELQRSRLLYEETSEDVYSRMHAIQDNEIRQLRELSDFLDLELNFAKQYGQILEEVKSDWCNIATVSKVSLSKEIALGTNSSRPANDSPLNSMRSQRSDKFSRSAETEPADEPDEPPRKLPLRRKSEASSRPTSRPASRTSRKRADSGATAGDHSETEKVEKINKRMSVAGWASSAVISMTGRGKKDKENFSALMNDDDEPSVDNRNVQSSPTKSRKLKPNETGSESPRLLPRALKPSSSHTRKVTRALYDFTGASDELTFKAGDEIMVISEVLEDWWLGELHGRKGLFPISYTEPTTVRTIPPSLPPRNDFKRWHQTSISKAEEEEEEHPFGDHQRALESHTYGPGDTESITSTTISEEEEERRLVSYNHDYDDSNYNQQHVPQHPSPRVSLSSIRSKISNPDIVSNLFLKKAPPPPPPRRFTTTTPVAPPLPERRMTATRSHSSGSLPASTLTPASSFSSNQGRDVSPFDSLMDVSAEPCQNFRQDPFEPRGMCSNCFQKHQ